MSKVNKILILGIESSCDDTGAAVLLGDKSKKELSFKLLSNVLHSQIPKHAKWGGVVPELAAREHLLKIEPVVAEAIKQSGKKLSDFTHIAVTAGPGLIGSLLVGVEFAKGLSLATNIPVLPVNHMEGHLYSAFAERYKSQVASSKEISYPLVSLVVSGGHTMIVVMQSEHKYKVVGSTVDDAAGEAFDKVAKLLGLPYPGGPHISKLALKGKPSIDFPRPMLGKDNFDFSFSGLKTSVRYYIEKIPKLTLKNKQDIARSFEDAVIDVLVQKTIRAAENYKAKTITLTGGVSANIKLRETLASESKKKKIKFIVPPFELCTDNAGMIAIAGLINLRSGKKAHKPEAVRADSTWEIWE